MRHEVPASQDEDSDDLQEFILQNLPTIPGSRNRRVFTLEDALPVRCINTLGTSTSTPNIAASSDPSCACKGGGQTDDEYLSRNYAQEIKTEPGANTIARVVLPPVKTSAETLVAKTQGVTPAGGISAMVAPKIELSVVDTVLGTSATASPTVETATDEIPTIDSAAIGTSEVVPVPEAPRSPQAYTFRDRNFLNLMPYTIDHRKHKEIGLGRGDSVEPSTRSRRGKNLDLTDLQDDENDLDYVEGQEDLDDNYYGQDEGASSSTRRTARSSLDAYQMGIISKNLLGLNLTERGKPSVERRRLYQRRGLPTEEVEEEEEEEKEEEEEEEEERRGKDGAEVQVIVEKKKKRKKRINCHVLPRSFFGKHNLPDDIGTLKETRREELSSGPAKKAQADQEVLQLAHHAKRRIVSEGQDGHSLGDYIARLALDNGQSASGSDISETDPDGTSSNLSCSPSPSPQLKGRAQSGRYGFDHGYNFSDDDEAFEVEIRTFPTQATRKRYCSGKKTTAKPRTVFQSRGRLADSYETPRMPAIERRRVDGGENSTSKTTRRPKVHSPYTYADPHESNKDRGYAIQGEGLITVPVGRKRKAMADSATDSRYAQDPYAVGDMMRDTRRNIARSSASCRTHILLALGSQLKYSHS
ncbi:hypothetical protein BGZ95_004452, partial [Linnemannia exigua]